MADTPHVPVVLPHDTGIDDDHLAKLMAILYYVIGPHDASRAVGIPSSAVIGVETLR